MDSEINRENFDAFWFEIDSPNKKNTNKFKHFPIKEKPGGREKIKASLIQAIIEHHLPDEKIQGALKRLGFEKAAGYLKTCFPKRDKTRKGNFGEIVAAEHLCQRYKYTMPIFKLRFMENPNMPSRGDDIVAFEISQNNKITAICIGEVKVSDKYSSAKVKAAHEKLLKEYPKPGSLQLISNILHEKGENILADQVDEISEILSLKPFPRHNWVFIINGNKSKDTFYPIEKLNISEVIEHLSAVDLHLSELPLFINEIFDNLTFLGNV